MKITKRNWLFHLLGLLALVLVFGVMLSGCDASTVTIGGGLILGGIIGNAAGHVFIGIIIGGIVGFVVFCIFAGGSSGSSSSSSSGSSFGGRTMSEWNAWGESRKNDPHKCGNCKEYSSVSGECKLTDSSKSPEDSCSNWC